MTYQLSQGFVQIHNPQIRKVQYCTNNKKIKNALLKNFATKIFFTKI